ncbi:glycine cleavage system protein GcvH [Clostridium algidicarnis]|uniref:glycine cleavage system protein GcvH n=1 Tax=Clostridium algidicarnis TaxID=37659 RepID=UPI0016285710|nr:glycine cleavage system protein GcvH [Clostridium algidicarnis]MBB6697212.1 glycine cleavage system protein GcvH [Clostridium algidicarnis]MBU3192369.1 glycine cleavage system protein GcvH [Clostridium algidicarnis]MBU3204483.1 glycine cleavage system protein GcvH [Clostridium algidicarnis]MBU3206390.1 glycine cleavage system protein GcvH [Clostridium algidicarnis]MBU3212434.1 glycine cleavage system protein GcvH [Clostridium algidicarnis]
MKVLKDLLYTKDHDWVKVEGDKAYIGLTDFAQHSLGSIVFVELPEIDSELEKEEVFGVIESVKAASDSLMPISGKVLEINEEVVDNPSVLNDNPYDNWLLCVEVTNKEELNELINAENYQELCNKEG